MNIRPYDQTSLDNFGDKLQDPSVGGTHVKFDARISADENQLPFMTPMYIREGEFDRAKQNHNRLTKTGGIIPQIEVRKFVPDRTNSAHAAIPANPITIHVYPGKDNVSFYSIH